jgi:oligosaccharide reducing-end xylanase
MNSTYRLSLVLFVASWAAQARTIDPPYQVAAWSGFKTAAVSHTFDDNCSNQLAIAVPIFNEFNFTLTLFTVTNWAPDWPALRNASAKGHEIASHTVTHALLSSASPANQDNELKNSRTAITTNVPGRQCVTMAYPNCAEAIDSITSRYYIAARGCSGAIEATTPAKFMNISSIVCGSTSSYTTAQSLNGLANQAIAKGGWCVYLFHGIDNDGGYSPISSSVLRTHLRFLDSLSIKIWVSPFGNVVRYIKERDSVSVRETFASANSLTVRVTDNLDNLIYDYPITVKRSLPGGWNQVSVTQNGKKIASAINGQDIVFDAVPDNGDIVISNGVSIVEGPLQIRKNENTVLTVNAKSSGNGIVFTVHTNASGILQMTVFDMRGIKIASKAFEKAASDATQFLVPGNSSRSGIVIVTVRNGLTTWSRQITVF